MLYIVYIHAYISHILYIYPCNVISTQCYTLAMLYPCNVIPMQCYTHAMLYPCNVIPMQCYTHANFKLSALKNYISESLYYKE